MPLKMCQSSVSVPENIRLIVGVTEDRLRKEDVEELQRRCARVTRGTDGQTEAGRLIRSITLLWRRGQYTSALIEAQKAVRTHPKNGDVSCILGRSYLLQTPPDFDAADNAFRDAQLKRCERPELIEYWAQTKLMKNDIAGLLKFTQPSATSVRGVALLYRFAGLYRIARQREVAKA